MKNHLSVVKWWHLLLFFTIAKLVLHLVTNGLWSFHRDALLYLALGRNLDWGYASVPPSIAAFAWFGSEVLGGSVEAVRLIPSLFSTFTLALTMLMAREMTGGRFAMLVTGLACLLSPAYLRPGMLFQPVVFDIFYWTLFSFLWVKYLNTAKNRYLLWLGAAFGLGLLNKYSALFFLAGLLPGLLFTKHRQLFFNKKFYLAGGLAFLIFLPNLIWQVSHGFPVARHMEELARTQFVHVSVGGFLLDQVFQNLPALPLWVAGLLFLLFEKNGRPWRMMGWMYLAVVILLLALSGKSYYTLGAYPVLIAAGASYLEKLTEPSGRQWLRYVVCAGILIVGLPLLPVSLPVFKPEKEVRYLDRLAGFMGTDAARRWEDGNYYPLPQDFADMLGWEELADIVGEAWQKLPDKETALIYAENYGQAGAIEHFGKGFGIPKVISFSDSYRYWLPDKLPANLSAFLYVNDELGEDMPGYFGEIQKIGEVTTQYARERGTEVYLCRKPTPAFFKRIETATARLKRPQ